MARPDDFELFALYHLGLEPDGTGKFMNAHQIAARYGVTVAELTEWLRAAQIDADTAQATNYDLAEQHGEVQVLAMLGDKETALRFARHVFAEYKERLGGGGKAN